MRRSPSHVRIPTSTLVTIPATEHLSNIEAPDRFNAEDRAFWRSVQTENGHPA